MKRFLVPALILLLFLASAQAIEPEPGLEGILVTELENVLGNENSLDISVQERCSYNSSYSDWEQQCFKYSKALPVVEISEPANRVTYRMEIFNKTDNEMVVYGLVKKDEWKLVSEIVVLQPFERKQLLFPIDLNFSGKENESLGAAVVGISQEKTIKRIMALELDWSGHIAKKEMVGGLVFPGIALAVFILALLIFVTAGVIFSGKGQKKVYKQPNIATRIVLHPGFWLVEIAIAVAQIWYIFARDFNAVDTTYYIESFMVAGVFAMVFPLIFLIVIWLADFYEREPLRFVASMMMWGFVAAGISLVLNTFLFGVIEGAGFFAFFFGAVVIAPLVEETSKGFGVFLMSKHDEMNGVLDGIVYGFSIGLGFALIENWLYFANLSPANLGIDFSSWVFLLFYRSIFSCLGHGWMTATTGAILGFFKRTMGKSRLLYFLPAVATAIILHGLANFSALPDGIVSAATGGMTLFFNPVVDIGLTVVFGAIILAYTRKEKEKLRPLIKRE